MMVRVGMRENVSQMPPSRIALLGSAGHRALAKINDFSYLREVVTKGHDVATRGQQRL
jgi:hypothetical protein